MPRSVIHHPDSSQSRMKRNLLHLLLFGCVVLACAASDTRSTLASITLERTHWTLTGLGAAGAPIAKTQTEPFLVFGEPPGRVTGSGGCNRLAGRYEQKGDKLTFGPIAGTRMACADGMQVEDALGSALSSTTAFRIAGDRLELLDAAGARLASFQAHAAN